MKKIEFETSKGKFVVFDEKEFTVFNQCTVDDKWIVYGEIYDYNSHSFIKDITEEQASDIIEERELSSWHKKREFLKYYDYTSRNEFGISFLKSAIDSLHSLIKSEGYYLFENPFGNPPHNYGLLNLYPTGNVLMDASFDIAIRYRDADQKTFYNPCIFKKV